MSAIYLDSCIVIYLVEGPNNYRKQCYQALMTLASSDTALCFTDLTRLECRVLPLRKGQQQILQEYDDFFRLPEACKLSINEQTFEIATDLRAVHNIRTADALHLASAMQHNCKEFWTNDLRLNTAAANHLRIVSPV